MKKFLNLLIILTKRFREKIELAGYNEYTIENLFRKQGAQIGKRNRIFIRKLDAPYLVKIGNHCTVASGVCLLTHDGGVWIFRDKFPDLQVFGPIEIEDNCFIGQNAIILPGVKIGKNSVIGAGAVVTKSIPPNSVAAGSPARVISTVEDYFEKAVKKWEVQRPPGYLDDLEKNKIYEPEMIFKKVSDPRNQRLLREHLTRLFWAK